MIQPQNRQMSMSLYLASIAVVDTIVLILGAGSYMCDGFRVPAASRLVA